MNGIACAFQGTLGGAAELRSTAAGKAVLSFRVAVSDNRPVAAGVEPQSVRVACWGPGGAPGGPLAEGL
jgi:hypothetical protein